MNKEEKLKEQLKASLENERYSMSDKCYDVLSDLIEYYTFKNRDEFENNVYEVVGEAFIYYSSAFNYLQEEGITNFECAISEGFGYDVCSIASYYLEEEVFDKINELDFDIEDEEEE